MKKRSSIALLVMLLVAVSLPGVAVADEHIEVLEDVATIVPVKDLATAPESGEASFANADCQVVVLMFANDGSSQEFASCTLNDEPLPVPEQTGTAPETTVTNMVGECIFASDYHMAADESIVPAEAGEVSVTPSGRVFIWSSYPAEPLDCPE